MKRLIPILLFTVVLLTMLPAAAQNSTYYALQAARIRRCPSTFCASLGSIQANSAVQVITTADGQKWNGSKIWYQVSYQGLTGYVHSSLLTTLKPGRLITPGAPTLPPIDIQPYLVGPPLILTSDPLPIATDSISLPIAVTSFPPPAQQYVCDGIDDLNCSDFASQHDANVHLAMCGYDEDGLDGNNDGQACKVLPP